MADFESLTDAQRQNLAKAAHKLFQNPDVSKDAKRLLMKADPSVKFPEVQVEDEVEGRLNKRDERINELENKLIQQAAEQRRRDKHAEAKAAGIDPDEVEKAITERGIVKWETAMEFVRLQAQAAPATAASLENNSTPMPDDKDFWKNPQQAALKAAHAAVDELKQRRNAR